MNPSQNATEAGDKQPRPCASLTPAAMAPMQTNHFPRSGAAFLECGLGRRPAHSPAAAHPPRLSPGSGDPRLRESALAGAFVLPRVWAFPYPALRRRDLRTPCHAQFNRRGDHLPLRSDKRFKLLLVDLGRLTPSRYRVLRKVAHHGCCFAASRRMAETRRRCCFLQRDS